MYLQDQLDADDDLTMEQRLALAGGSALEGVGDAVGCDAVGIAGDYEICEYHKNSQNNYLHMVDFYRRSTKYM